jgi:hypothetical protein
MAELLQDAVGTMVSKGLSLLAKHPPLAEPTRAAELGSTWVDTPSVVPDSDACAAGERPIRTSRVGWLACLTPQRFPALGLDRPRHVATIAPSGKGLHLAPMVSHVITRPLYLFDGGVNNCILHLLSLCYCVTVILFPALFLAYLLLECTQAPHGCHTGVRF